MTEDVMDLSARNRATLRAAARVLDRVANQHLTEYRAHQADAERDPDNYSWDGLSASFNAWEQADRARGVCLRLAEQGAEPATEGE